MENKLIPDLRFPEFDDEWVEKKLSDLFTFKNGVNASKEDYGKGYKFINVLDIIQNDYITNDRIIGSVNISESEFNKNIVEYGDVLFQRSSETREEVGQANVYLDKELPATFGGFVIRGKKKIEYDPSFMNALLKTSRSRKEITSKSGGSTRYNVGQDTLSEVVIYTTKTNEQTKIANFLTAIDKRIQILEKKKTELEQYKKGVIQKLFNRTIRFKKDDGSNFPDWTEKKLGEVCKKESSNLSANTLGDSFGEYKVYGATGYLQNVDFYNEKEPYISIVKDGAGVGRTLLCEEKTSVLGTLDVIRPKAENNIYFIFTILNRIHFVKYITGSTIPHIYFRDYSKEKVFMPCLIEQGKIANFIISVDKSIEKVGTQIDDSNVFKKGLLQKMFV
tara:strand:+ start:3501 stop:4673 length:1173 start_codon:yes stop_codon:yes gene_type:complete